MEHQARTPDKIRGFCLQFYELEMKSVWVKQISRCKLQGVNRSPREGTESAVINSHLKCCSLGTCPNAGGSPGLSPVCRGANRMIQHGAMALLRDGKPSGKHCS